MRSRGWAVAASAAVVVLAAVFIWALRPADTLAHEVITHIEGEPKSWTSTEATSTQALDAIMQNAGIVLESSVGRVMYARSCLFRVRDLKRTIQSPSRRTAAIVYTARPLRGLPSQRISPRRCPMKLKLVKLDRTVADADCFRDHA